MPSNRYAPGPRRESRSPAVLHDRRPQRARGVSAPGVTTEVVDDVTRGIAALDAAAPASFSARDHVERQPVHDGLPVPRDIFGTSMRFTASALGAVGFLALLLACLTGGRYPLAWLLAAAEGIR